MRIVTRAQATRYVSLQSHELRRWTRPHERMRLVSRAGRQISGSSLWQPAQEFLIKPEPGPRSVSASDYPPEVAKRSPGRAPLIPAHWWAHVVGAPRLHPHKHSADYCLRRYRGNPVAAEGSGYLDLRAFQGGIRAGSEVSDREAASGCWMCFMSSVSTIDGTGRQR